MFASPGYLAFSLGSLDVHWYGIIISCSIFLGLAVVLFIGKKYFQDISADSIFDITFILIVFGIIFARLYYVLLDLPYFMRNPLEIPAVWNGGISIQGAILGGIIAGYWYAKSTKISFFRHADLFSFGLIAGQALGRWGNFFNSEAFGLPAQIPWKLYIPYSARPENFKNYEFFHPAFLYESLLNIIIFIILFLILTKFKKRSDGTIFFCYLILYSIARILVESIRLDSILNIYNFHIAQITAIFFIIFAVLGLILINKKNKTS